MFNKLAALSVVALLTSSVSTLVIPRATAHAGWATDLLEDYTVYNTRYRALGCQNQHNTDFFHKCCHPLLKDEKLESRPAECTPSPSASASATASSDEDLDDCEEDEPTPEKTTPATSARDQDPPVKVAFDVSLQTGGFATFFYQNGVAGACGKVHQDSDFIAAIDYRRYGNTGVRSGLCGKRVEITNNGNGKKVTVEIADACPTCNNGNSIDLSVAAFKQIAHVDQGIVPISWKFI